DKDSNTIACDMEIESLSKKMTKRNILSAAQKVFDPIGFTSPEMVVPKMLMQEARSLKLDWDQELPKELKQKFWDWYEELEYIKAVRIPRNMTGGGKMGFPELHLFTDASKDAYAAVVYLRNGNSVQLVQAKSRVAPM